MMETHTHFKKKKQTEKIDFLSVFLWIFYGFEIIFSYKDRSMK